MVASPMVEKGVAVLALILILPIVSSSGVIYTSNGIVTHEILCTHIDELQFDGEKANESVAYQVGLGPRIPESNASFELRASIAENLSGWEIQNQSHLLAGLEIVNLEATLNAGAGNTVVLMAHYDTRQVSDEETDENLSLIPVPGANDGASGVAVLLELGRLIPTMNLSHEVRLVFTDVEDQGNIVTGGVSLPWASGSQMWTENLTDGEVENMSSLIVVDMIGDSNLTLTRTTPGNETLWQAVDLMAISLGMVADQKDCNGNNGTGEMDLNTSIGIWDDHVPPLARGIPAIDIIDVKYGSDEILSGHWHTQNDTIDKVSSQSLESVGRLVELGLISLVFSEISESIAEENDDEEEVVIIKLIETETEESDLQSTIIGTLIIFMLFATIATAALVVFAENEGEL